MNRILLITMTVLISFSLVACNGRVESNTPAAKPSENGTESLESIENQIPLDETAPDNHRLEITGSSIEEELFVENLDISVLVMIADEIQTLVEEIHEKERASPEYVLEGRWNQDFRSSKQYGAVVELGLSAVKPAYYIIYKSNYMGLYEYILASAIDEITGYDYSVTEDYNWSNSKEFLELYNDKVKNTLSSFREIMENTELSNGEKAEQICRLGIFAITPLLQEMDSIDSALSQDSLEKCLWNIVKDFAGENVDNLECWRSENEQTYRDIIEILDR